MAKFNFTLLYVSIALVLAVSANADSFGLHRREHADLGRLLKKRMPAAPAALGSLPFQGQQSSPTPSDDNFLSSLLSGITQGVPSSSSSTGPSPSSTNGGSSSSSSSTGPSSSSSSSTSSSTVSPSMSPTLDPSSVGPQPSTANPSKSVVYLTTGLSSAPSPTQSDTTGNSSALPHTAVTILIVLAVSVGASVIAWTIVRKWKFRPSSDFEGRMQPIDWEPGVSGEGKEESGVPGHRRPLSRSSSFHSGSANSHAVDGAAAANGYGGAQLNPIPDHDFTAGPANPAPVGGYADLARGATPQPMMQEHHGLPPIVNRPAQYDQYGVPLHHGYGGY